MGVNIIGKIIFLGAATGRGGVSREVSCRLSDQFVRHARVEFLLKRVHINPFGPYFKKKTNPYKGQFGKSLRLVGSATKKHTNIKESK